MLSQVSCRAGLCAFALAAFSTAGIAGCREQTVSSRGSAAAVATQNDVAPASDSATVLALASTAADGMADRAIARARAVAVRNPSKADAWTLLGEAWIGKARESSDPGYYLNANACADLALRASPSSGPALDLRAMVLLNEHRFEDARALVAAHLASTPDDATAYGVMSDALLELGRLPEAVTAAQSMMDLKPNAAAYARTAHLRWLFGDAKGAQRVMRDAIDATSPSPATEPRAWVLVDAAVLFWHQGDYDGANAGFDLALRAVGEYPPALVGKARVRLARGDGAGAAALLERAYARNPLVETAWLLGDARRLSGDESGARQAYAIVEREGRRTDPRTLSLFESTTGRDPADALALAENERAVRDDPYTEDAYAWALYRNGRFAEARQAIDAARRWGTPDARLMFHAGAVRVAQGEGTTGRALIAGALALNPEFDLAGSDEARRILGARHARR